MSKRKLTTYIGRFSGFHNGHAEVLLSALKKSQEVLVIIGSAFQPRRVKNPWKANERAHVIQSWYNDLDKNLDLGKLTIRVIRDYMYNNDLWLTKVQEIISSVAGSDFDEPVYITGADRDSSTFYLKMFPEPTYKLDLVIEDRSVSEFLSGTKIRQMYFGNEFEGAHLSTASFDLLMRAFLPKASLEFLLEFKKTPEYDILVDEYSVINQRKEARKAYRYPIKDQTVDAIVIQSGYILLVRRRAAPGRGLWALPGGHLEEGEWMLDGAIRELNEETKIDVPKEVLYGSVKFDFRLEHPDRSEVGRVISQAFVLKIPDIIGKNGQVVLADIKGSDDAEIARWFPISDALKMSDLLFDDHYEAIEMAVSRLQGEGEVRAKKLKI